MKKDIDKMLKIIESTEPSKPFAFRGVTDTKPTVEKRLPFYRRRVFVSATAAMLAVVILLAVFLNMPFNSSFEPETPVYTPKKPNINYTRPYEDSVNAQGLPWENGSLRLTTLSTSGSGLVTLSNTVSRNSRHIDLSFIGNTKIVSCSDGNLVRINTQTGDHAGCRGVYYNIHEDNIFCVACAIKESVALEPYYIDACIRALIEECILTNDRVKGANDVSYIYTLLIEMLYENGADKVFMRGEMPTVENMGLDLSNKTLFDEKCEQRIAQYKYPIINVLEFGASAEYCLYGIASSRYNASWGNFMMELDTGVVTSLNGDNGANLKNGQALYNHIREHNTKNKMSSVDLYNFASIAVSSDYSFAVATAPFFRYDHIRDIDTGMILKTNFNEHNVYLLDLTTGGFTALLGENYYYVPEDLTDRPYPLEPAQIVDGVICYPTKRNTWYFYYGVANEFCGELMRICTYDGVKYAVMLENDTTFYYRLTDGADVTESVFNGSTVLPEGVEATSPPVSVGNSSVSVWSKNGHYKYSYLSGENKISCVEITTGATGEIEVPKDFIDRVGKLNAVQYCMFIDNSGTRLILSYYDISKVTFNRSELYHDPCYIPQYNGFNMDYIEVDRYVKHFYDINGSKITLADSENVHKAVVALSYDGISKLVENYVLGNASPEKYNSDYRKDYFDVISAACDEIAKHLNYDGENAHLSDAELDKLLKGLTYEQYEEKYAELISSQYK